MELTGSLRLIPVLGFLLWAGDAAAIDPLVAATRADAAEWDAYLARPVAPRRRRTLPTVARQPNAAVDAAMVGVGEDGLGKEQLRAEIERLRGRLRQLEGQ